MKSKLVLVFGVILALTIAVGCSTDSRTTAPNTTSDSFSLPNDNSVSRFSSESAVDTPIPAEGGYTVTKIGVYHATARGCQTIRVMGNYGTESDEYIELTFAQVTPKDVDNGAVILVKGTYRPFPGGFCMLPSSILVEEIFNLGAPSGEVVESNAQF